MRAPRYTTQQLVQYMGCMWENDPLGFYVLREAVGTEIWCELFNAFPKGEKMRGKAAARELEQKGAEIADEYRCRLNEAAEHEDIAAVREILDELKTDELAAILVMVNHDALRFVNQMED